MDRVHYRRVSPPRNQKTGQNTRSYERSYDRNYERSSYNNHDTGHITVGETIIMQCVISGVLMVVVLLAAMLDIAPAITLRSGLRQVLVGATTVNELVTEVRYFGEEWLGWEIAAPPAPSVPLETENPQNYNPIYIHNDAYIPYIPILQTPTANYEPSNPQIPGPSVVPGLWD